ncbi:MAG: DoxX family membrane protein [Acidimicrobiia bacterium]
MNRTVPQDIDRRLTHWLAEHGVTALRISIGVVFFWFGVLKFWPGLSPADQLATETIDRLSFGLVPGDTARILLAVLETSIGVGLVTGRYMRFTLLLLVGQMLGTVTPLFLFPDITWADPFVPTLEGQYILKNIVLVSAALTIGATVRGGGLVDDPEVLELAVTRGTTPTERPPSVRDRNAPLER